MKTVVIIILAVVLTWYMATFGIPIKTHTCDTLAIFDTQPSSLSPPPIDLDIFELINKERYTR